MDMAIVVLPRARLFGPLVASLVLRPVLIHPLDILLTALALQKLDDVV